MTRIHPSPDAFMPARDRGLMRAASSVPTHNIGKEPRRVNWTVVLIVAGLLGFWAAVAGVVL